MIWQKVWSAVGHSAPVYSCCADSSYIYSSSGDRFVTRWLPDSGIQDSFAVKLDSPAYVIGICENQNLLVIGCSNGTVVGIDTISKALKWEQNIRGNAFFSFTDCPEHNFFLLGDSEGELFVMDYTGKLIAAFPLACGKIRQIRLSGNEVFLCCQDSSIRRIELHSFNEIQRFNANENGVNCLLVFLESHALISVGRDAHLKIIDLITENTFQSVPAHYQNIYGIEKLGVNQFVTTSMDKSIKIWNREELKVEQKIEFKQGGHNRSVNGCVVVKNGFVTFGDDKRIIFWSQS